jgi:hypothetical protein
VAWLIQYDSDQQQPKLSSVLNLPPEISSEQLQQYLLSKTKDDFVELARKRLPKVMGTRYAEVVETCLTCLDPNNPDFGDPSEFEDEDGIRVGVRYIEKVGAS